MSYEQRTKQIVRLGLFVTISITLFVIAVYFIGSNQNLFGAHFRISSVFSNVSGLQPGNNVHYAGIKVGAVERIVLLTDSTLRVDMMIEEKVKGFIKKDAIASIGSDGLVGSMLVNISPGKGQLPSVENDDILASYSRLETEDILNTLGKTNENLAIFSNDLLSITHKVERGKGVLSMLLQDSVLANEFRQSMINIRKTTAHLEATSQQIDRLIDDVEAGEGLLGMLLKDTSMEIQLEEIIGRLDAEVFEPLETIVSDLQTSGENINAFSVQIKEFSGHLNSNEGMVGALLSDSVAVHDLKQTLHNLNEGTDRFNENMEAMKHNFLFRKYFKKQEKKAAKGNKQD